MICKSCGAKFDEIDQTRSEYKAGQCPICHSEDIKEEECLQELTIKLLLWQ